MVKKTITSELWQDYINPPLDLIEEVMKKHDFHELDQEAILEEKELFKKEKEKHKKKLIENIVFFLFPLTFSIFLYNRLYRKKATPLLWVSLYHT